MTQWIITYGLTEEFNNETETETIESDSFEEAYKIANLKALELLQQYEGQKDFPSIESIMENDEDITEDTAKYLLIEELEELIYYNVL